MSTIFDNDVLVHIIAAPGLPGDGFTTAEAATVRDDLDTLLARPQITGLDEVPDVDAPSPANGEALVFDTASGTWKSAEVSGTVGRVQNQPNDTGVDSVHTIIVQPGLTITTGATGIVYIAPTFGGTGANAIVARNDHTHQVPLWYRGTITPQGYMSGSTRTLATVSVPIPTGLTCHVEARVKYQVRGGDTSQGNYTNNVTIAGNTRSSGSGLNGFWCVQGVPKETEWSHRRAIVGTGASITVSASVSWNSGGGFYTDAGELEILVYVPR